MSRNDRVPSQTQNKAGILINRDFAFLLGSRTVSGIGDTLFDFTLILWIAVFVAEKQSWAPLAVGGVLITSSLAKASSGPIAGVFVDRWRDRRRIMLWMDACNAGLMLLFLLAASKGISLFGMTLSLPLLWLLGVSYAVVLLMTICTQFASPSFVALSGDIVEESARMRASGLIQVVGNVTSLLGPPLATFLFFTAGLQWAILLNALTFIVSFLCILAIHPPLPEPRQVIEPAEEERPPQEEATPNGFFQEFVAGLHYCLKSKVLVTILLAALLGLVSINALNVLGVFFVEQNLRVSASLYGVLTLILGLGLVAGSLLTSSGVLERFLGATRVFWLGIVASGVIIFLYARLTSFLIAAVVIFLLGMVNAMIESAMLPLILHVTSREFIGRVFSTLETLISLIALLSVFLSSYLASEILSGFHATFLGMQFGPIDTLLMGTGVLAIIGGLLAMINLRHVTVASEESAAPREFPE